MPNSPVSSYLASPGVTPHRSRHWAGFRNEITKINRISPGIWSKALVALAIWTGFFGSVSYVTTPHNFAGQASFTQPAALSSTAPAALASVVRAPGLPTGPSGQPLPPGTMAAQGTYANNYARGQCTWYVAGRRQVPSGWGNARNWYYRAISSGWKTGSVPAVAAIAWTPAGTYGHVALVEQVSADGKQVLVSEMNYRGLYFRSSRWVNASAFKYIY